MRIQRPLAILLVLLVMIPIMPPFFSEIFQIDTEIRESSNRNSPMKNELDFEPHSGNDFAPEMNEDYPQMTLAEGSQSGVMNPLTVEQQGYYSTGRINARTDTGAGISSELIIDTSNGWLGDLAEVNTTDLTTIYALNGTFSDGVSGENFNPTESNPAQYGPYGWNATSYSTNSGQNQLAAYDSSEFVVVQNEGVKTGPSEKYTHYAGTYVYWHQNITNYPSTSQFRISFRYYYLRGPIGSGATEGNTSLVVNADGTKIWDFQLPYTPQRKQWYDVDESIDITGLGSIFNISIGIKIDDTMDLNPSESYAVTVENAVYFTVYIDDFSLVGRNQPTPDEVDLKFNINGENTTIAGSANDGYACYLNSTYWNQSSIPIRVTSNATVAFNHTARMFSHLFSNSTTTTNPDNEGATYTIDAGASSDIATFTYLGSLGSYEEFKLIFYYPDDWENVSVFDPFLDDVTSQCTINTGNVSVPASAIDALGWWEIEVNSFNYVRNITTQILDTDLVTWYNETIFRPGNSSRAVAEIGLASVSPPNVDSVDFTWILPNSTIFTTEISSAGIDGVVNSSGQTIDSSLAGPWSIEAFWLNGTQIGYDSRTFGVVHRTSLAPIDTTIETELGATVTSRLTYKDLETNTVIKDESAVLEANWTPGIVTYSYDSLRNWWSADLDTNDLGAGDFLVNISASLDYYDAANCTFYLLILNTTRLTSPNSPYTSAKRGELVNITLVYEVYSPSQDMWGPISNGTGETVAYVTWAAGFWSISETTTDGVYKLGVDTLAESVGEYELNITFVTPNHRTKQVLVSLIVSPESTSLEIFGETSVFVDLNAPYDIKLRFNDTNDIPISLASVNISDVSPESGLDTTIVTEVSGEPGNYTVTVTTTTVGLYTIRFEASAPNVQNATAIFVIGVNNVETVLEITSGASGEIPLYSDYLASFSFASIDDEPIYPAEFAIFYSGPSGGLSYDSAPTDYNDGNYSISFSATIPGNYLITIAGSKQYYQSASDSFFLSVLEIETFLTVLNGSSDTIYYGESYNLAVEYLNGTETPLNNADVAIVSVTPTIGVSYLDFTPATIDGVYSIELTAIAIGSFTILVQANLTNHQTNFATFTLNVAPIGSVLKVLNSTTTIAIDQNFTLYFSYEDSDGLDLEDALLEVTSSPDGLSYSTVGQIEGGIYYITLVPEEIGTFDILFRASKFNYQNASASFTLRSSNIPTALVFTEGVQSGSIEFRSTYDLTIQYIRTDCNSNVTGATILLSILPDIGLSYRLHENGDIYIISLRAENVGQFKISILVEKDLYLDATSSFILDVAQVSTAFSASSPPETVVYGRTYEFPVSYSIEANDTFISNASINPTQEGSEWITSSNGGPTEYTIVLQAFSIGTFEVKITFSKDGYQSQSLTISFNVVRVPVVANLVSGTSTVEGTEYILQVELKEAGTNTRVSNATLLYRLPFDGSPWAKMTETNPGLYVASVSLPTFVENPNMQIELKMDKENYELSVTRLDSIFVNEDVVQRMMPVITYGGSGSFLFILAIVALRIRSKRKRKKRLRSIAIRQRFQDARNIIGFIAMHKETGLSLYSQTLKGGFDETMISAFISAITLFRSQFGMEDAHWEFQVIPISDIISVVPTRYLVCAFITGTTPSSELEVRMQAFGRAAGAMFDEMFAENPTEVIDEDTKQLFYSLFVDIMDGDLLRPYTLKADAKVPRTMSCLIETIPRVEEDGTFKLDDLAIEMTRCGIDETDAYIQVLDAVEGDLLEKKDLEADRATPFISSDSGVPSPPED